MVSPQDPAQSTLHHYSTSNRRIRVGQAGCRVLSASSMANGTVHGLRLLLVERADVLTIHLPLRTGVKPELSDLVNGNSASHFRFWSKASNILRNPSIQIMPTLGPKVCKCYRKTLRALEFCNSDHSAPTPTVDGRNLTPLKVP